MNFSDLSAYGRSTTATAVVTNPVRRILLWLMAPYFRGASTQTSAQIEQTLSTANQKVQELQSALGSIEAKFASCFMEIEQRQFAADQKVQELISTLGSIEAKFASRFMEIDQRQFGAGQKVQELISALGSIDAKFASRFMEIDQREFGADQEVQELISALGSIDAKFVSRFTEIEQRQFGADQHLQELTSWLRNIGPEFASRSAQIEQAQQGACRKIEELEQSLQLMRTTLNTQLGALRKEQIAVASRLASLEDEAEASEAERLSGRQSFAELTEWLQKPDGQVSQESARLVALTEWFDKLSKQISRDSGRLSAFTEWFHRMNKQPSQDSGPQHALGHTVESLALRLDSMARGTPLRAGDNISLDKNGLTLIAPPQGPKLMVRRHDHIGRVIVDGGEWEPHVRKAIEQAARPDEIAIDAGSYVGVHTLTMARCFRTVHAFEPQREIYQMLCGNLALNGYNNVMAHNIALYDRAGSATLAPQERQETPLFERDGRLDYEKMKNAAALSFDFLTNGGDVRVIALDEMELEDVALIKVDTQGADLRVLKGAAETIKRCRPTVLFEWERDLGLQHGSSLEDFLSFFNDQNYEVTMIADTSPGRQADYLAMPR